MLVLSSAGARAATGLVQEPSAYRSRAVRKPRALLREFGTVLPEEVVVRVHDSSADMRYLVLPTRPSGTEGLTEAELAEFVTRDSMIGVSLPRQPETV